MADDAAAVVTVALLTAGIDKPLSYRVPDQLRARITLGSAVAVPVRQRVAAGIVVELGGDSDRADLKPIHALLHDAPALNANQLSLARWIADEYFSSLGRACGLMVPPGFTPRSAHVYALAEGKGDANSARAARPPAQTQIIAVLSERGPMLDRKLRLRLRRVEKWQAALKQLVEAGVVTKTSTLEPPKARPVRTTLAQLVISDDTLEVVYENLAKSIRPNNESAVRRRTAALDYLRQHNGLGWADWLCAETTATRADLNWLVERNYILLGDAERWRDPLADVDYVVKTAPPLTSDQQRAWDAIKAGLQAEAWTSDSAMPSRHPQFLLRGVTGSGKTEIYMRAVELVLRQGKGALILVPEISLTPQTSRRFLERFPGKVALVHSRLTPGERFDTWRRIRAGELPIVVGARSALFAPLPSVGLIVLDEEHDSSYKHGFAPMYDARRVAAHYARIAGATLILGSATPSLEAMHNVSEQNSVAGDRLRLLELPNRVRGHVNRVADQVARLGLRPELVSETENVVYQPMPDVQVVDMRAELRGGNTSMFSGALHQALAETLARNEQAILFLNRRGTASCVLCRDCGEVVRCPNDDTPLTLHVTADAARGSSAAPTPSRLLKCHQCDHTESVPAVCPSCGRPRIRFIGLGTQKIEQALHETFPKARVARWDKDAATSRSGADQLLKRFVEGQADVLVGTQMIAKGLDLPRVTLVGVVLADVGLFLPDFRASERGFQLIEQVAGRAGRGLLKGRVIVQTYNPDHPAVVFAKTHDVLGFDRLEMQQRRQLDLPPFTRLVRFEVSDEDNAKARKLCEAIARQLRRATAQGGSSAGSQRGATTMIIGPAQAYFTRRNKKYRWQVLARTDSPRELLGALDLPRDTELVVDVDPVSVL